MFTTAPPPGSRLVLVCADQLASDLNAPLTNCTVSTGGGSQQSVAFAAHVSDASGIPLADVPVQFAITGGSITATTAGGNVTTNANGNAVFVVTEPNPVNNEKITVQATVGNPTAGGLGPAIASVTFQTPKPSSVLLTPTAQQVAAGATARLTAKVVDQFGAGVPGQAINFSVTGRNSSAGSVTTGADGTAAFTYTGASGSDTVTASDVSTDAPTTSNPAHATVTFGAGSACTTNCPCTTHCGCSSNCTGREHPTLRVRQTVLGGGRTKLSLVVISHPSLVNAAVTFFQIRNGVRHRIGTGRTGGHGNVTGTLRARHGQHLRFVAKVAGKAGVSGGFSKTVGVRVR